MNRSRTMLTEDILLEARNLLCIGTFCIGTNQVDLKAAERLGVSAAQSSLCPTPYISGTDPAHFLTFCDFVRSQSSTRHFRILVALVRTADII